MAYLLGPVVVVNVLKLLLLALHEIIEDEDNNRDVKNL
jgi:hypothetical protein